MSDDSCPRSNLPGSTKCSWLKGLGLSSESLKMHAALSRIEIPSSTVHIYDDGFLDKLRGGASMRDNPLR